MILKNIHICLLSETKIDETFPNQQFNVNSYKKCCRGRIKHAGGLLFYINENVTYRLKNDEVFSSDIKWFYLSFWLKLWIFFLKFCQEFLSKLTRQYKKVMLIGGFT